MNIIRGLGLAVPCAALLTFGSISLVQADDDGEHSDQPMKLAPGARLSRISGTEAAKGLNAAKTSGGSSRTTGGSGTFSLPVWTDTVKSTRNGSTYTLHIVGTNPATGVSTTIPTYLIPVKLVLQYNSTTSFTFDPTGTDPGCLATGTTGSANNTALSLTEQSPVFTGYFLATGQNSETTQYPNHFNRSNFWTAGSSNSANNTLLMPVQAEPVQTVILTASNGFTANATVYTASGQCGTNTGTTNLPGYLGVVNINTWDSIAQSLIHSLGLNAGELPVFLFYNAVLSQGHSSNLNNCCILGYHNAVGSPIQTYAVAEFEGRDQTLFGDVSDVSSLSHEINEWMQDPGGNNPAPAWGGIGQVSGCQNNYEVGDPLSSSLLPPVTGNANSFGFTYHLQELAFLSWFYGSPSIASNGLYSNNGTFQGPAKTCPPGGTN